MRVTRAARLDDAKVADAYDSGELNRFELNMVNYLKRKVRWPRYTHSDVERIRRDLRMSQAEFGALLNVTNKTILRWEASDDAIPPMAQIVLCMLDRLGDRVFDLMDAEEDGVLWELGVPDPKPLPKRIVPDRDSVPDVFSAADVKKLHERLDMTRGEFSDLLGVSRATIDKWESGVYPPKGTALNMLKLIWIYGPQIVPNRGS